MADYYPVIARTVSKLSDKSAPAREELYEQARSIIATQLRRQELQKSAPNTMDERAALETAIRRVEAETLSTETQTSKILTLRPPKTVVVDDGDDIGMRRRRLTDEDEAKAEGEAKALPAPAQADSTSEKQAENANNNDAGGMSESLGVMLIGIAFAVGIMAFTGLMYAAICSTVW
jgi:hypothetical protein